jgi:hypothetical protein
LLEAAESPQKFLALIDGTDLNRPVVVMKMTSGYHLLRRTSVPTIRDNILDNANVDFHQPAFWVECLRLRT